MPFFDSISALVPVILVTPLTYLSLIFILRVTGKRTLSKLNAFDFVVTVALGSTLSATITSKDIAFVEGVTALTLLVLMQLIITWLSVRFNIVDRLIKSKPQILYLNGEFQESIMKETRVNRHEILQAMRQKGFGDLREVEAVILETSGNMSVLGRIGEGPTSTLPA